MKTAMQKLISTFHLYQNSASTHEEQELLSFYIKCAEDLLEKEKEQIIEAFVECWKTNGFDGFECKLSAKEYFDLTYNQNK
jgi:hypothetical protein